MKFVYVMHITYDMLCIVCVYDDVECGEMVGRVTCVQETAWNFVAHGCVCSWSLLYEVSYGTC